MELLKQGNSWLEEAESFMHSISAIEKDLEAARRDSPGEINAAQTDITSAWQYINAYDEDIRESLEDDLREAEKKLNSASEELRKTTDYLKVVKLARESNESADRFWCRRVVSMRLPSGRAPKPPLPCGTPFRVSIAREYIQDHSRDAGEEARSLLVTADSALRQAETASDLNTQISLAEKAENAASRAYSSARAGVESSWGGRLPVCPR
jgi:hypothetical protein